MVTFRNNNNRRNNFRRNDRNFKNNSERSKFGSNFSNNENFQRKIPGRNNHNASKLIDKYNNLAREALSSGDKILSENYFQHAEHFTRIVNEKAKNSYELLEYFEAGIVLTGPETKSIRNGGISIIDAFAIIENEEAFIREMNIEAYKYSDLIDYEPKKPRKILLHKKEIKRLIGLTSTKGNTLIATKVFEKNFHQQV